MVQAEVNDKEAQQQATAAQLQESQQESIRLQQQVDEHEEDRGQWQHDTEALQVQLPTTFFTKCSMLCPLSFWSCTSHQMTSSNDLRPPSPSPSPFTRQQACVHLFYFPCSPKFDTYCAIYSAPWRTTNTISTVHRGQHPPHSPFYPSPFPPLTFSTPHLFHPSPFPPLTFYHPSPSTRSITPSLECSFAHHFASISLHILPTWLLLGQPCIHSCLSGCVHRVLLGAAGSI